jgi:predicted XRE-type DNA-binding protein
MAKKTDVQVTPSTGNVFRDLGFPRAEAEHLLIRADLLIQLQKAIEARGLKQSEAARVLAVTQPRVSDLLRGRIDLFSTDTLIDMLARLGIGVRLVVKTPRARRGGVTRRQIHAWPASSVPKAAAR